MNHGARKLSDLLVEGYDSELEDVKSKLSEAVSMLHKFVKAYKNNPQIKAHVSGINKDIGDADHAITELKRTMKSTGY